MPRIFPNWLEAYVNYTEFTEAPRFLRYWVGVATIAGALRRKVWIDQYTFKWFPNHYIIIVAPPDIVAKTTTLDVGMNLLSRLQGVNFGPTSTTWQALSKRFADINEAMELSPGKFMMVSPMTVASGEFGNFLDTRESKMIDLLVDLWDGKKIDKITKHSGSDFVEHPLLNLIAATTPSWVKSNIPSYMLDGGLLTRCIFIYAYRKERLVSLPRKFMPKDTTQTENKLVHDLQMIGELKGEVIFTEAAEEWMQQWYEKHFSLSYNEFEKVLRRKQSHLAKLSIIESAATSDSMFILPEDLERADKQLGLVEESRKKVFYHVGQTEDSQNADTLMEFIRGRKEVSVEEAYREVHKFFPKVTDFKNILQGFVEAGLIELKATNQGPRIVLKE